MSYYVVRPRPRQNIYWLVEIVMKKAFNKVPYLIQYSQVPATPTIGATLHNTNNATPTTYFI